MNLERFEVLLIIAVVILCSIIVVNSLDKDPVNIVNKTEYYNNTEYITEEFRLYFQNVFPSEQCRGFAIEDMTKMYIPSQTGSMRPYIYSNDMLLTVNYNPNKKLVLGDVVANKGVLHRIVGINTREEWYNMKGDNNKYIDFEKYNFNETDYVVCGIMRGTDE